METTLLRSSVLNASEVGRLKLIKQGLPLDDEMRERLADAQCIARAIGGWALTVRPRLWEARSNK